ncbi:hypothetical protein LJC20_00950 [Eubacteriales bacterium OttesenSCG-928-M02]|nr:hypothetical protein [Eubacteriales bacterium OttesenSCG-928-M02]
MKLTEVVSALDAQVCCGADQLDRQVKSACGADLMSDVLAFVKEDTVLLTGMNNTHAVRTAEMVDVPCIVFVRGKQPGEDVLDMAKESGVVVLRTEESMFTACGKLYAKGLQGAIRVEDDG